MFASFCACVSGRYGATSGLPGLNTPATRMVLRKQKNAQVSKGERLKLTARQRAAAVVNALRDFGAPGFDYAAAREEMRGLDEAGLKAYQEQLRRFFYADILEQWRAFGN